MIDPRERPRLRQVVWRALPDDLASLADLAIDVRWTWSHASDRLWSMLHPDIWASTRNPRSVLQSITDEQLQRLAHDPTFTEELQHAEQLRREYLNRPGWFTDQYRESPLTSVAYFSMEFGLGEALPLYAGGLGILAGDMLKTASDLDVPMTGVGLLFQEGYFRQILDRSGWQTEAFPFNDPISLPVQPVLSPHHDWLHVALPLPGRTVFLRVWCVQVGRVRLYLLDSNSLRNSAADRGITSKLYDAQTEQRLLQEMVLGIGGYRMLDGLGIHPDVCHLNEGHAACAVLERARSFAQRTGSSFREAFWTTRAGNVFTTHTPVSAAFDTYPRQLVERNFAEYARELGMTLEELLRLGQADFDEDHHTFTPVCLAMRGSLQVNGVSELHGHVSRRLFQFLYPRWPEHEVPITSITNGIHVPSWDSQWADALWTHTAGKGRWLTDLEGLQAAIEALSDQELWRFRHESRAALVTYARQRLSHQYRLLGMDPASERAILEALDPHALTLGFARRFTAYKRPTLLLHDRGRLAALLKNTDRPVQLIVAGKAHPQDEDGKRLVQAFVQFARSDDVRQRVVFLQDYDIDLAQQLVQGVDVWINTPKRPWEACGTSGMKVLVNGGLNLSEVDGWWAEAYNPGLGWAMMSPQNDPDVSTDAAEAEQLYDVLERDVIPMFYRRNEAGIPVEWVARMRNSMAQLTPRFSSNRMLREYVERLYLAAATRVRERAAQPPSVKDLLLWEERLARHWDSVAFGEVLVERHGGQWTFIASLHLGELPPDDVTVELYADAVGNRPMMREPMHRLPGRECAGAHRYEVRIMTDRPANHFTIRAMAYHPNAVIPQEASYIRWQR